MTFYVCSENNSLKRISDQLIYAKNKLVQVMQKELLRRETKQNGAYKH